MDSQYEEVKIQERTWKNQGKGLNSPLLKQLFVVFSTWLSYFLNGLAFGIPTVMIPQIRKAANSSDAVTPEMASWLYSVFMYSALPWIFIICFVTGHIGRKIPFALVCLNMFVYFNLLYFSTTLNQVLIAEIMQGVTHACHASLTPMVVTEYVSPKYRGLYMTIKSANFFWGFWVANAIGTFYDWRYIPMVGIFMSLLFVTVIFWPESPQWLAMRGDFDKCRTEYRWLRGISFESEKELEHLIQSQMSCLANRNPRRSSHLRGLIKTVSCKAFYKPLFLTMLLGMQYVVTGKMIFAMYAIDIIKNITASESTAYIGMLILDGVTIVGMYTGCVLSRFLNRRRLLFSTSFTGIGFLLIMSLYLFLTDIGVLVEDKKISLGLLTLFSVAVSAGPLILVTAIGSEMMPLRYKSSISMIAALSFSIFAGNFIKIFPFLVATFHMFGTFLTFALLSITCNVILYIYLPETKDKSLQEIEEIILTNKKTAANDKVLSPLNE